MPSRLCLVAIHCRLVHRASTCGLIEHRADAAVLHGARRGGGRERDHLAALHHAATGRSSPRASCARDEVADLLGHSIRVGAVPSRPSHADSPGDREVACGSPTHDPSAKPGAVGSQAGVPAPSGTRHGAVARRVPIRASRNVASDAELRLRHIPPLRATRAMYEKSSHVLRGEREVEVAVVVERTEVVELRTRRRA